MALIRSMVFQESTMRFVFKLAAAAAAVSFGMAAQAQEKIVFLTSWYAQAEHGGFYQALAKGLYKKAGLDVTIKMGGPQVNGQQLLLAGQADMIIGYDFQVLKGVEQGFPLVTVAASFQKDLQGMLTHDDIKGLEDLKGKTILVAGSGQTSWWPWIRAKYGYADSQSRPYTFNLQPFFADKTLSQQAYPSSEPFQAQKEGVKAKFFLFADYGYPPYGTTVVTTQKMVKEKPEVIAKFIKASMEGWKSYLTEDPAPANALIKADNKNMSDEQIAFGIKQLNALKVASGGDAAKLGIGAMTDERWKATYDYMVSAGLLKKEVDYKQGYTLQFVKDIKVLP
jgi:NitT/TauT family transport system substrate-binding protein